LEIGGDKGPGARSGEGTAPYGLCERYRYKWFRAPVVYAKDIAINGSVPPRFM